MSKVKLNPGSLIDEMRNQVRLLEDWDPTRQDEFEFNKQCDEMREMIHAFQATIGFAYDVMKESDE